MIKDSSASYPRVVGVGEILSKNQNSMGLSMCGLHHLNRTTNPAPRRRKFWTLVVPLGSWVRNQLASQARRAIRGDSLTFRPPPACTAKLLLLSVAPPAAGRTDRKSVV